MIVLERYDDLDWARDKTKTPAAYFDVPLTWKNKSVTIDLSQDNYDRLNELLSVAAKVGKTSSGRAPRGRAKNRIPGRRSASYYEGLRTWADENHVTKKDGSGRPAYEGREGKRDYPDWLIAEYDEHLAALNPAA